MIPPEFSERLTQVAWLIAHLDDVRSDFSVFHRVDDLETLPATRFVMYLHRLHAYSGSVQLALRELVVDAPASQSMEPEAPTAGQLAALNTTALYGPVRGEAEVGLFDTATV